MVPVALTLATAWFTLYSEQRAALARVAIIALAVLVPRLTDAAAAESSVPRGACNLAEAAPLVANHAGRIVLADANDAPELLYLTICGAHGRLALLVAHGTGRERLSPQHSQLHGPARRLAQPAGHRRAHPGGRHRGRTGVALRPRTPVGVWPTSRAKPCSTRSTPAARRPGSSRSAGRPPDTRCTKCGPEAPAKPGRNG